MFIFSLYLNLQKVEVKLWYLIEAIFKGMIDL